MQIRRKPTAIVVAVLLGGWNLIGQPLWNLGVEKVAERAHFDKAISGGGSVMSALWSLANYVPSSFGLGFAAGALIFAYWDTLVALIRKHVFRKVSAIPAESKLKVWVGNIDAHFEEKSPDECDISLTVINWGAVGFKISAVTGNIILSHDNGHLKRIETSLPTPVLEVAKDSDGMTEPGYTALLTLKQHIPLSIVKLMPDMFAWNIRPYFDLRNLVVELAAENGETRALKLWENIRLTSGTWAVKNTRAYNMFASKEEHERFVASMKKLGEFTRKFSS